MSIGAAPPHDLEAEAAFLGAVLLWPEALPLGVIDEGLRAEHFYREQHAAIFRAMARLHTEGEPVDPLTVAAAVESERISREDVDALAGVVPAVGNAAAYARRIVDRAELRQKRAGALTVLEGVAVGDLAKIADGEGMLATTRSTSATSTPEQLGESLMDHLERAGGIEAWPWPFRALTSLTTGGMKRGEVTLIGGWSSHGKSAFLDDVLETAAKHVKPRPDGGGGVHLYINEMTREQRSLRRVSRVTGIDFGRLLTGRMSPEEKGQYIDAATNIPYGITDLAELGGTVEVLAHHIRAKRWDIAAVDILHLIEHDEERDLARISRTLNRTAKLADCHILATVHLNEKRVVGATRPYPTTGDIRGSGMLKNDADNVVFVYREQTPDGTELLDEGRIYLAKVRNGVLGGVPVFFNGRHMRFEYDGRETP